MKNIFLVLCMVTLTISCGKSNDSHEEEIEQLFTGIHSDGDPLPSEAYTFDANFMFVNANYEQQRKLEKAIEIIKKVVATEEFRSRVINHTYRGEKTFVDNGGHNNSQIYQKILDGAEKLRPYKNNIMDAEIELYYAPNNIVGYTYANSHRIWVNTKYFNNYTAAGVAHNLFHEWLHKLGYGHASSWSSSRDYSVPYSLGYLMGELGKKFL